MVLIRLAALLTAYLAALGPTTACGNPDAEAWESLISEGGQVEKELEALHRTQLAFFASNPKWTLRQCMPDLQGMDSGFGLLDLSWELDRWQTYAEALAEGGAGHDPRITAAGHLGVIKSDVWAKRQAFDRGLEFLEMLRCPVNPWK